jgi:hypothetical protein
MWLGSLRHHSGHTAGLVSNRSFRFTVRVPELTIPESFSFRPGALHLPRPVVIWDRDDQSREGDELNHRGALLRWQAHRTIEGIAQRNGRGEIETSLDLLATGSNRSQAGARHVESSRRLTFLDARRNVSVVLDRSLRTVDAEHYVERPRRYR